MIRKRAVIGIVVLLGFLVSCAVSQSVKKAPDFSLVDVNGKKISLSSFKGKIIVLNFWASWCPPCKAEIPDFVKTYEKYKDKGLVIIGIAVNSKENDVKALIKQYNISYPVALDDGSAENAYGPITGVPTTFIIDKEGNLVPGGKKIGMFREGELEKFITPLLK
ncbi:MAG: TlpA family protein disulfide reductase [Candidatus Omnitrophica bacterium]|nr:TlpA family protein disulfide reductase [Candidatus Omnitrophota bacterium]MCM8816765.1 TlpA family protein disulfide reductase [Candidatus Omnitrophota bacterium]